ncbi:MAG: hypothetical protein ACK5YI_10510, partial [Rhodospirillales bacterium]
HGDYARLQQPVELGLAVGSRADRPGAWADKRCLILAEQKNEYQRAISDLSNSDIEAHGGKPEVAVEKVRHWLAQQASPRNPPGPAAIWSAFEDFMAETHKELLSAGFSEEHIRRLPMDQLVKRMQLWVMLS